MRLILSATLALLCSMVYPARALDDAEIPSDRSGASSSTGSSGITPTLKGTVESEDDGSGNYIPMIPKGLQPGRRFDLDALTRDLKAEAKDYSLPHWIGGAWQARLETKYPATGPLVNGVKFSRREVQRYGTKQNPDGTWTYAVKLPKVHEIDGADSVEYRVELTREFPTINLEEVSTKYTFYAVTVSKFDNLIECTRYQISSARITPVSKSEIQIAGILSARDTEGHLEKSRSIIKLTRLSSENAITE